MHKRGKQGNRTVRVQSGTISPINWVWRAAVHAAPACRARPFSMHPAMCTPFASSPPLRVRFRLLFHSRSWFVQHNTTPDSPSDRASSAQHNIRFRDGDGRVPVCVPKVLSLDPAGMPAWRTYRLCRAQGRGRLKAQACAPDSLRQPRKAAAVCWVHLL